MITTEELERLRPSCHAYYADGGRYGGAWMLPQEFPRLFFDPDYYNHAVTLAALQPGERALDILCGNCVPGALSIAMLKAQPEATVMGLDPSELLLKTCQENLAAFGLTRAEWVQSDDEQLDVPDASVDVIVNRLGYHHIADLARTMGEYARILRPGGRVIILDFTVPDDDQDAFDYINEIYRSRDRTHVYIRSVKEMRTALEGVGFTVNGQIPYAVRHVTTEFGFRTDEMKRGYQTAYRAGSQHAKDIHKVQDLPDGELTFTHPAVVLRAVRAA